MMFLIETEEIIEKLRGLYPAWNPTATEIEALKHKLKSYDADQARQAVLDTWEAGKRTAPMAAILTSLAQADRQRKLAARQRMEREMAETPVVTDEEVRRHWAEAAAAGSELARKMCRSLGIA
jgi:hypothetical protein